MAVSDSATGDSSRRNGAILMDGGTMVTVDDAGQVFDPGYLLVTVELTDLVERGVVGEINLRYYSHKGELVSSSLDERVVGLTLQEVKEIDSTVCVAGGNEKFPAILGAMVGKIAGVLITDHIAAGRLLGADARGGELAID